MTYYHSASDDRADPPDGYTPDDVAREQAEEARRDGYHDGRVSMAEQVADLLDSVDAPGEASQTATLVRRLRALISPYV